MKFHWPTAGPLSIATARCCSSWRSEPSMIYRRRVILAAWLRGVAGAPQRWGLPFDYLLLSSATSTVCNGTVYARPACCLCLLSWGLCYLVSGRRFLKDAASSLVLATLEKWPAVLLTLETSRTHLTTYSLWRLNVTSLATSQFQRSA